MSDAMSDDATASGEVIARTRLQYEAASFDIGDLAPTWLEQLRIWLAATGEAGVTEPGAMVLATADADGMPSARTVLLRGLDERGLVFYTNLDSQKGRELRENPRATVVLPWISLHRQVIAAGPVKPVSPSEADAYWGSRPPESRVSAAASPQSQVVSSHSELESLRDRVLIAHPDGDVPRPAHWSGFRLAPARVEFWQGRPYRFHDRLRYRLDDRSGAWVIERLAP
jgi:pyridoxamine 5'-phosphate oxidase